MYHFLDYRTYLFHCLQLMLLFLFMLSLYVCIIALFTEMKFGVIHHKEACQNLHRFK